MKQRRLYVGLALALVTTAVVAATAVAGSSRAVEEIMPPKACGQDVTFKKSDPDGVLAKLPAKVRAWYPQYPYEVRKSPWANFAGKPGPWKIGYVSFPVINPFKVTFLDQLKKDFAKAKAKGLVTGSLQTYIQPSFSSATPEQQSAAIAQMVRDGVDGILIHPLNAVAETAAIDAAGKAGVPVVITGDAAPDSTYAVNVLTQNQSRAFASFFALQKKKGWFKGETRTALDVQGIPGNAYSEVIHKTAVADIKSCPGIKIVGTVWGQWNPATTKAEVLKFLAGYPGKLDFVMHEGAMGAGIIQAFEQLGRPVPPMPLSGITGGDLSWWAEHKSTFQSTAVAFTGNQYAYTTFRVLLRILAGKGLKVRDIAPPGILITNANVQKYAVPGKPVTWLGQMRSRVSEYLSNRQMDVFFRKGGAPGGL